MHSGLVKYIKPILVIQLLSISKGIYLPTLFKVAGNVVILAGQMTKAFILIETFEQISTEKLIDPAKSTLSKMHKTGNSRLNHFRPSQHPVPVDVVVSSH